MTTKTWCPECGNIMSYQDKKCSECGYDGTEGSSSMYNKERTKP